MALEKLCRAGDSATRTTLTFSATGQACSAHFVHCKAPSAIINPRQPPVEAVGHFVCGSLAIRTTHGGLCRPQQMRRDLSAHLMLTLIPLTMTSSWNSPITGAWQWLRFSHWLTSPLVDCQSELPSRHNMGAGGGLRYGWQISARGH